MLKHHSSGESFKPSASEANAWTNAALYTQGLRSSTGEKTAGVPQHSGVVWVKNISGQDIPRFGFLVLTEPLFMPEGTDGWDDDLLGEVTGRVCFKADKPVDDVTWDLIYNTLLHAVIVQEAVDADEDKLVPAVAVGLSWCKITHVDPGADDPNYHPTTCRPDSSHRAQTSPRQGPFKIIWMEEEDNDDGFRWALVNVDNQLSIPLAVHGMLDEDADIGDTKTIIVEGVVGETSEVSVHFRFWGAPANTTIGAVWVPTENTYTAWSKTCENDDGGSDDEDGGSPTGDDGDTDGGDPLDDGDPLDGGTP